MIRGTFIITSEGSKPILENFSDCVAEKGFPFKEDFVVTICVAEDVPSKHESCSTDGYINAGIWWLTADIWRGLGNFAFRWTSYVKRNIDNFASQLIVDIYRYIDF